MTDWNIFARELNAILAKRRLRLGHLDDYAGIHRETVRRLQKSLYSPKNFALLNPDDLESVIVNFNLRPEEIQRLKAAILATSVEAKLMGRVPKEDALRTADAVFNEILEAIKRGGDDSPFNAIKGGSGQEEEAVSVIEEAEAALYRAMSALHQSYEGGDRDELYEATQLSLICCQTALRKLALASAEQQLTEEWKVCHERTTQMQVSAQKRVDMLT